MPASRVKAIIERRRRPINRPNPIKRMRGVSALRVRSRRQIGAQTNARAFAGVITIAPTGAHEPARAIDVRCQFGNSHTRHKQGRRNRQQAASSFSLNHDRHAHWCVHIPPQFDRLGQSPPAAPSAAPCKCFNRQISHIETRRGSVGGGIRPFWARNPTVLTVVRAISSMRAVPGRGDPHKIRHRVKPKLRLHGPHRSLTTAIPLEHQLVSPCRNALKSWSILPCNGRSPVES